MSSGNIKDDIGNTVDNYDDGVDDYVVLLVMIMMVYGDDDNIALVKVKDTTRQNCNFSIYFRNKLTSLVPV